MVFIWGSSQFSPKPTLDLVYPLLIFLLSWRVKILRTLRHTFDWCKYSASSWKWVFGFNFICESLCRSGKGQLERWTSLEQVKSEMCFSIEVAWLFCGHLVLKSNEADISICLFLSDIHTLECQKIGRRFLKHKDHGSRHISCWKKQAALLTRAQPYWHIWQWRSFHNYQTPIIMHHILLSFCQNCVWVWFHWMPVSCFRSILNL